MKGGTLSQENVLFVHTRGKYSGSQYPLVIDPHPGYASISDKPDSSDREGFSGPENGSPRR